jgi:hypothetical protein
VPLLTKPAASIDEVVGVMTAIEQALPESDGVWWFNHLYLRVTLSVGRPAGASASATRRFSSASTSSSRTCRRWRRTRRLPARRRTRGALLSSRTTAHVHPLQFPSRA